MVPDVDAGRVPGTWRVGGLSASMYRLTVARWIPDSLAILRMDIPSSLAFRTAYHRALWRNVCLLGDAVTVIVAASSASMTKTGPFSAAIIASNSGTGSRSSLRPSGNGDGMASLEEGVMPLRKALGLGGASWAATDRPDLRRCGSSQRQDAAGVLGEHNEFAGNPGLVCAPGMEPPLSWRQGIVS